MNKLIDRFYELKNNIVVFMLSLFLLFGIASEAFAEPSPRGCPDNRPCGQYCTYRALAGKCVPKPSADDLVPTDTLNSTNSNPLAPSSSAVAPPIGNPTP
jgi:hypothetical protein